METVLATSLDEALDALTADPGATVLAGGTDLMVSVAYGDLRPSSVVSVRRIPDLHRLDDSFVGAAVTWAELERGPWPAFAEAARTVGSPQIRAVGTLGGNLGTASPAGDGLPFLAAIDAEVVLVSRTGTRSLPWHEFITGPKSTALGAGEIILGASIPPISGKQAFAKVGARSAMVISIASACLLRDDAGSTRIALGSVGPKPMRARRAEEMISAEHSPSSAAIDEFARLVTEEVTPIDDHRSTAAYRRHAAGVISRRLLERCLP